RMLSVFGMQFQGPNSISNCSVGYAFLDRYVRTLSNVEKVSIFSTPTIVYSFWKGEKIKSFLKRADGQFWEILEFKFLEGGPFTAEDEKNANFVAVINEATRRKFFGDEPAVGKMIEPDGQQFRVIGVVGNVPIFRLIPFADIWVPISTSKTNAYKSELLGGFMATILARSADDLPAIKSEFESRMAQVEFPDPRVYNQVITGVDTHFEGLSRMFNPGKSGGESQPKIFLASIITLMILFMVLPAVNLININVSRILERASEI